MSSYGTVAVEEAVVNADDLEWLSETAAIYAPGQTGQTQHHALTQKLADIHDERLKSMDANGVDYMLLSLTSPGCQGESDPAKASKLAITSNNWLASQVALNPKRFGALAAVSMHDADEAAAELKRAVQELGMFGALINDFQSAGPSGSKKKYYDTPEYLPFWKMVQELDVPVYLHPRYPAEPDLQLDGKYGPRKQILGAAVQFHLDLSFHIYALCSSGIFDQFPGVQVVIGHMGEGIPFNLWRADHWYNKPVKKATRPSKHDYKYYFTHNVSITTSGNFSTDVLKFCIDQIGIDRCLFSIDYPYDTIQEAQDWWKTVDLPDDKKRAVARSNAVKLFKLPLES
ncbi:Amidohydrolase 2 [Fusarium albosuccineum]|uniref:Amidohydrolase 2 n=1 Tax=Fusarium albosuccineum TaxID=1237068 RepID=A0A8H4LI02_9HYPO|nr:Amidohydrolase 2 [Fusarium albosuccineum]